MSKKFFIKTLFISLTAFFLLFQASATFSAISSIEAIDFVQSQHFLFEGEKAEINPNVKIKHSEDFYWVVSIVSGNNLNDFIPVKDSVDFSLAEGKVTRRELFKTAYALRLIYSTKQLFYQQDQWLFTNLNADFLNELAVEFNNEAFDLSTAESELSEYPELLLEIDSMKQKLTELSSLSSGLSEKILDEINFESSYFSAPNTNELEVLREKFDSGFQAIFELKNKINEYNADVDKLKQGIAKTDLSTETKRSLSNLVSVSSKVQRIPSLASSATNLEQKISEAFDLAANNADTFVENFETRLKKNNAFKAIYGANEEISSETKGSFTTLDSLVNAIFAAENEPYWINRAELSALKSDWSKTQTYFKNRKYDLAVQFANKARKNALLVYNGGLERDERPVIGSELLINIAIGLTVLLVIIYVIRNRGRLSSVIREAEEEEVEIHGFKKI